MCNVRSQSAGCPTSSPIDFLVPGLEGHHFVAWGVDRGMIDVGFFQLPHAASDDASSSSVSLPSSWRHLISLNIATTNGTEEAVTHLAFGGGPHVLLAAATRTKLAIFSLEPLMDHVFQADTVAGVAYEHESRPWELSPAVHNEHYLVGSIDCINGFNSNSSGPVQILSISWTHQLDGVLVSDTARDLSMWQLKPIGGGVNSFGNNVKDLAVITPSSATCASLRCAWKTTAPEPQDLLSAGVSIDAPSASAASFGEKNANVWWPENSSSNAGSSVSVRREKLKHTCNIVSLEWCPGVLRKDVFAADISGAGAVAGANINSSTTSPNKMNTSTTSNSTIPPIEDHPALMTLGADTAVRLWVEMLVVHHAPIVVQSHNTEDKEQQQQAPAPTLDSYFAMALVVDAPDAGSTLCSSTPEKSGSRGCSGVISTPGDEKSGGAGALSSCSSSNGSMIARWVRGSGSMMGRQQRGTTSSEVLWLVLATKQIVKERERDYKNNVRITEAGVESVKSSTNSINFNTSHWLVKLYAVRGLSAVVVANVPGSVAGVSSLSGGAGGGKKPQAVLWGQHLWSGAVTQQDFNMSSTQNTLSSFSAWMSAEDDFPMVTCFDITACTARPLPLQPPQTLQKQCQPACRVVDITAAGVTYATVLAENPALPSSLHQRLDALTRWKACTAACSGTITSMSVCPSTSNRYNGTMHDSSSGGALNKANCSGDDSLRGRETAGLVATVDETGRIALWHVQHGIVEYLQGYSGSGIRRQLPTCLQWVSLPSSCTPPSSPTSIPSSVAPPSTAVNVTVMVTSPLHALIVGAGRDLLAMYPSNSSINSTSVSAATSELDVLQEVEYNIMSLHVFNGRGGHEVLLVLQTLDGCSSPENAIYGHPAYVTLFEIQSKSTTLTSTATSTTTSTTEQQQHQQQHQKIMLKHLGSASFGQPSSFSSAITAVTPVPSPPGTSIENNSLCLLVGTATGHVHTAVLPFTDTGTLDKKFEVSKPVILASSSSSTSSSGSSSFAVVALAVDGDSGTAAAVLVNRYSTGMTSTKSYLALWKLQQPSSSNTSTTSSPTPTTTATAAASTAGATPIRIPLESPGACVSWLTGLMVPCVLVGDIYGNMTFYAPVRDATEGWKAVAKVEAAVADGIRGGEGEEKAAAMAGAVRCLHGGGGASGPVVAAVGSRVVCASNEVVVDHELKPLSRHLVEVAGPLPQYHPRMLQALLLGGHRDAACAVLRALTTWAPQYLNYQEQQRYCKLYRTTSDLITGGNSGLTGVGGGADSGGTALLEAPTPRAAAELEAAGPPPFPAISLDQFVKADVVGIPAKLVHIAEKTKEVATGRGSAAVVEGVARKLSEVGFTTARTSVPHPVSSSSAVNMVASGQLDMSSFLGMGDDFGDGFGEGMTLTLTPTTSTTATAAVVAPPPPPGPPGPPPAVSAMDTGMLDMAAFGMDMMPPPREPEVPSAASSIETGSLDLSSFGMAFDIPAVAGTSTSTVATSTTAADPEAVKMQPPIPTHSVPSAAATNTFALLTAPKQAAVPISDLRPFSSELLTRLHQIVGLVASKVDEPGGLDQEESSQYSNHGDLSFLRGTSSRQYVSSNTTTTTAALDLLRSRPLQPLPGLTLDETQDVVAIATYFSSEGVVVTNQSVVNNSAVDEAGAHFLTALNLACSRPFDNTSNMPFTHDYNHNINLDHSGGGAGSSAAAALASQASSKSLHKTPSSASTAALMKRSKSVRNAAGVEYTLAPSMTSMASFSSALGDEENEDDETTFVGRNGGSLNTSSDVLARRWGLAPGLQPSALLWAQLTSSPQALLDHALTRIAARDAEIAAFLQAEAIAQDASAADFLEAGGSFGSSSNSTSNSGPTWPALRAVGAGFWVHSRALLASTAEALAKSRFAVRRSPDDAALFYVALGKKTVLQGLYRTTNQTRQADFLGRDFSQVKHQQAACKNAFVLMGNHRPELAAAFFILGASPGDAVSVCVRELGDVQLALFIARLLHGPGSEAERALIESHILPAVLAATGAGQEGAQENGTSVSTTASSSIGGWASAATSWLLGDSSAFLKSILGLPTWPSSRDSISLRDGPEGLVQLLPALQLAAQITPTRSSSELPSIEILKSALLECCASASEALQSAGLPALALQFEAVAAACQQRPRDTSTSPSFGSAGEDLRAAWACAAALLSHPSGTAQASAIKKQLAALRAMGLDINIFEALKRIHTLQRAINPTTTASATGAASSGGLGSLFSPRAAFGSGGSSSLLYRQGSFDTTRSTQSMHSSGSGGGARLSIDGHVRHGNKHSSRAAEHVGGHQQKSAPLSEGSIIFQVDSDSLHGVACCPLISPQVLGRPIITATHRHGLLEFAAQAPPLQRHPSAALDSVPDHQSGHNYHQHQHHSGSSPLLLHTEYANTNQDLDLSEGSLLVSPRSPDATAGGGNEQSANMFSRFLSQIFDQSSWTLDPMERTHSAIDGDIGLVVGSAMASASSGHISSPRAAAGSLNNSSTSPSSSSGRYSFSTSINPQNTRALTLAAHSSRQLFLSGCESSGRVHLWQFGGPRPVASFTPVSPNDLIATQTDTGLLSFSFSTKAISRSTSLVGRLGHWGGARGLAFSPNGERFAAVGDGGVVATWRLGGGAHRPTDVDGALCAEWWHHCLSKEGRAVVYIGGGGSVVAVGGKCSSGNIALWDAASPPGEACVGRLKHHSATVNALCTMPGGWLVAAADAGGALSLTDIRMLGGSTGGARTLWSVRASKGAVQSLVMLPLAETDRPRALAMGAASGGSGVLVTGGQDGIVRVWQASSGKLLQSMDGSMSTSSGGLGGGKGFLGSFSGGGGGSSHPQGVTGLAVCEEGVVSCGADGTVRLFPLTQG